MISLKGCWGRRGRTRCGRSLAQKTYPAALTRLLNNEPVTLPLKLKLGKQWRAFAALPLPDAREALGTGIRRGPHLCQRGRRAARAPGDRGGGDAGASRTMTCSTAIASALRSACWSGSICLFLKASHIPRGRCRQGELFSAFLNKTILES